MQHIAIMTGFMVLNICTYGSIPHSEERKYLQKQINENVGSFDSI